MKPSVRIEHWYVFEYHGGAMLLGDAYGHPRFPDGTNVRTSRVLNLNGNIAETMNTMYELGAPAGDGELARLQAVLTPAPVSVEG